MAVVCEVGTLGIGCCEYAVQHWPRQHITYMINGLCFGFSSMRNRVNVTNTDSWSSSKSGSADLDEALPVPVEASTARS